MYLIYREASCSTWAGPWYHSCRYPPVFAESARSIALAFETVPPYLSTIKLDISSSSASSGLHLTQSFIDCTIYDVIDAQL